MALGGTGRAAKACSDEGGLESAVVRLAGIFHKCNPGQGSTWFTRTWKKGPVKVCSVNGRWRINLRLSEEKWVAKNLMDDNVVHVIIVRRVSSEEATTVVLLSTNLQCTCLMPLGRITHSNDEMEEIMELVDG